MTGEFRLGFSPAFLTRKKPKGVFFPSQAGGLHHQYGRI
jgi:hypothetical protein